MSGVDRGSSDAFAAALLVLRDLVLARLCEAMAPEDSAAPSAAMIAAAARFLKEHAPAPPSPSRRDRGTTSRPSSAPRPYFDANLDPDPEDDPESVREDATISAGLSDSDPGRQF